MRKFLMALTLAAGTVMAVPAVQAAPVQSPLAALDLPDMVQPAQYYGDRRHEHWRRREAYERFQRREARRAWRERQAYYGRPYGYGGGYGRY